MDKSLKEKLSNAKDLAEVKSILPDASASDSEKIWAEIERHRSNKSEKLDLDELDSVSGGADRDWKRDGCAATCENKSWCWSNDFCMVWDVTYDNYWVCCPDGHDHVYEGTRVCVRCGYERPGGDFTDN